MSKSMLDYARNMAPVSDTGSWGRICTGAQAQQAPRPAPEFLGSTLTTANQDIFLQSNSSAKRILEERSGASDFSLERFCASPPRISLGNAITDDEAVRIAFRLQQLTSGMLASIKGIEINSYSNLVEGGTKVYFDEAGHADLRTRTIHLRRDYDGYLGAGVFQHEVAHLHTYQLALSEINDMLTAIADARGSETADTKGIKEDAFEGQWMQAMSLVKGYSFGDGVRKVNATQLTTQWVEADGSGANEGPRLGCVESYGCQSFYEDVATHVQLAWEKPKLYQELIDPSSSFYAEHPEQQPYAPVYLKKLELLYKFGFITARKYREILQPRKPMREFCQIVNCP